MKSNSGYSFDVTKYENVTLLKGTSFYKSTLFKYIPFQRLKQSIDNKCLYFVSPENWIDPFEQLFWSADFSDYPYSSPDIAFMCLTSKCFTNEEALWQVYSNNKDEMLRVSFELDVLMSVLDAYASINHCKIYVGGANYSLNKKDILSMRSKKTPPLEKNMINDEDFCSLMCIKRKAFSFENEVRLMIVKNSIGSGGDRLPWSSTKGILEVPVDICEKRLIRRIYMAPKLLTQNDGISQKSNNELYSYAQKIVGCKLLKSHLYDKIPQLAR